MLTLEKFKQASEIVKEVTLPTKLVYSEYLSNQTGAEVYLKPENMQYTGAYNTTDQSKPYEELWCRSCITRGCL